MQYRRDIGRRPCSCEHAVKYAIITFGCRVNQADSLGFEEELLASGASAASPEEADLVVVNTCSVTASADQGARQTIRRIARANPDAQIVVTGCYATRGPDRLAALPQRCSRRAERRQAATGVADDVRPDNRRTLRRTAREAAGRTSNQVSPVGPRLPLRVQTGCAEPCSYCIIPSTRGQPRSVPLADILMQVGAHRRPPASRRSPLTGVHLGSYGRDLSPRSSLFDLLSALSRLEAGRSLSRSARSSRWTARTRSSISMPSSRSVRAAFPPATSACEQPDACTRCAGHTRSQYYARLVDGIRARLPDASIGSDVIVGFPGETDDDFEQLATYLEAVAADARSRVSLFGSTGDARRRRCRARCRAEHVRERATADPRRSAQADREVSRIADRDGSRAPDPRRRLARGDRQLPEGAGLRRVAPRNEWVARAHHCQIMHGELLAG